MDGTTEEIIRQRLQDELLNFGKVVELFLKWREIYVQELSSLTHVKKRLIKKIIAGTIHPPVRLSIIIAHTLKIPPDIYETSMHNSVNELELATEIHEALSPAKGDK